MPAADYSVLASKKPGKVSRQLIKIKIIRKRRYSKYEKTLGYD